MILFVQGNISYWGFMGVNISPGWLLNTLGVNSWVGVDLLQQFQRLGYTVHYAKMGPVSSNWDRACELYAQIMGNVTDYGAHHSTTFGHARFGKNYTGKGFL